MLRVVHDRGTKNAHVATQAARVVNAELVLRMGCLLLATAVVHVEPVHEFLAGPLQGVGAVGDACLALDARALRVVGLYLLGPVVDERRRCSLGILKLHF